MKRLLSILLLLLCGCSHDQIFQQQRYVFGTMVEVSIYGSSEHDASLAIGEVMREFERLHEKFHAWKPGVLSNLNASFAKGEPAAVDAETAYVIENATRLSIQSDHLFNPAIGKLIALWGFQADEFKPVRPDPEKIVALVRENPRMEDISLSGNTATSHNPAVKLDLGGWAKGYALDRALKILKAQGIKNALVNIGGNIIALGSHGSRPWHVGIKDPRKSGAIAQLDLEDGEAIGTSGDYQRYFLQDGRRFCHIIDPRSGYPADGFQSVTVLIPKGAEAGVLSDAASKPIFISGPRGWRLAASKMGVDEVFAVDQEGKIHLSEKMLRRIEFQDKNRVTEVLP